MIKNKIINDPVFGFITLPEGWLMDIIKHPYFQRLTRIKQLGLINFVYPGAQHTRFQHSLGAFHLMTQALETLMRKGVVILDHEAEAAQAAILLHDIGHGPFSHILEHVFVHGISHEEISLLAMQRINKEMHGVLDKAISIFKNEYPRYFFHQLICGQLDVDRLEYLCRDSFFTGVREGNIGSSRIIAMLNVQHDRLTVDSKGIYSIENYLTTRRLMYWQVYFHKTAIAFEVVLRNALQRAKELTERGTPPEMPTSLRYFFQNKIDKNSFQNDSSVLNHFMDIDDYDVWMALKTWCHYDDRILSTLAQNFVNRTPFKVETIEDPRIHPDIGMLQQRISETLNIPLHDTHYFIATRTVEKEMYSTTADGITLLYSDGKQSEVTTVSDLINSDSADKKSAKHYLLYQRI